LNSLYSSYKNCHVCTACIRRNLCSICFVVTMYAVLLYILGRRLGSPINAWEPPSHTGHSPQHSTASSSNVSITATPTISPGTLSETQSLSQQQQQPPGRVVRRQGQRKASRPMSMANILDHQSLSSETLSSSSGGQRRSMCLACVLA